MLTAMSLQKLNLSTLTYTFSASIGIIATIIAILVENIIKILTIM